MSKNPYPILEFDPDRKALINPEDITETLDLPRTCVICFFKEVLEKIAEEQEARVIAAPRWEDGPHPLYEIEHRGQRLAFFHPGVGGPIAAGLLEERIAYGCQKFIAVGGCGVLESGHEVGKLIAVSSALRDEGVSYHYLPPSREILAQQGPLTTIQMVLDEKKIPYITGKTWTTDAPYRETPQKILDRRNEGCLAVEMEAASLMAVAHFRKVANGQILYAGDDLSGEQWENRDWQKQEDVREKLFWLAADICLRL